MVTPKLAASLLEQYGALMTVSDLSELLGTTPKRISNGFANNLPWCRPFQRARIKIGRRVHLNTATVAEILEEIQAAGADFSRTTPVRQVWEKRGPARGGRSWRLTCRANTRRRFGTGVLAAAA